MRTGSGDATSEAMAFEDNREKSRGPSLEASQVRENKIKPSKAKDQML